MRAANVISVWECQEANRDRHFPPLREIHTSPSGRRCMAPVSLVEPLARAILGGAVVKLDGASVGRCEAVLDHQEAVPAFVAQDRKGEVLHSWDCPWDAALWAAKHQAIVAEQWLVSHGLVAPRGLTALQADPREAKEIIAEALMGGDTDDLAATILDHFPDAPLTAQVLGRVLPYHSAAKLAAVGNYDLSDLTVGRFVLNPAPHMPALWRVAWNDHDTPSAPEEPYNLAFDLYEELVSVQDHALSLGQMQPHNAAAKPAPPLARSLGHVTTQDMPARPQPAARV